MVDGWTGPKTPALSPPPSNICKSARLSPLPPTVTSSALFIEESRKTIAVVRRRSETSEQTVAKRKRFFVDAIFNEHRPGARIAEESSGQGKGAA